MEEIGENLDGIRTRVAAACERAGRQRDSVCLMAVSKTFPAEAVKAAMDLGHRCFGESRLQEAEPKLAVLPGGLDWHFIGRVQRNKVRRILPLFGTVHAVDSTRLARYMNDVAHELGLFPKVFLQVNVAGEESKGGFDEGGLREGMEEILGLDRLELQGLMCIPPAGPNAEAARPWFVSLRGMRDRLEREFEVALPALSMGMSHDFEIAIEEGASHVRVGSAIFGKRSYRVDGELG